MTNAIVPIPKADVTVRDATLADVAFIDQLQKLHRKQLGFMPESWVKTKIEKREVIVAVDGANQPVGYCIGVDRYFKRDDVGIIYQMNVTPGRQRGFVGATLLKAMFDRSAYGCRLYCCWCAQDIAANRFWESMGFVPLAFRAGSEKKRRVHIFWQKRIREGDTTTPWWFPAKTDAGAMGAGRLVLPIPPDKHWSDELPILLPKESLVLGHSSLVKDKGQRTKDKGPATKFSRQFGGPMDDPGPVVSNEKPKREKKPKAKVDPKFVAAARELRDRYLEHVNEGGGLLSAGKYDVSKTLSAVEGARALPLAVSPAHPLTPSPHPLLPAAA